MKFSIGCLRLLLVPILAPNLVMSGTGIGGDTAEDLGAIATVDFGATTTGDATAVDAVAGEGDAGAGRKLASITWTQEEYHHCQGTIKYKLEDGTGFGWKPSSEGPDVDKCKQKCQQSSSCEAFNFRHATGECYWYTDFSQAVVTKRPKIRSDCWSIDVDVDVPRPKFRWIPYEGLSEAQEGLSEAQLAWVTTLEYTLSTWNILGTNPIEEKAFDKLSSEQQDAAKQLGFADETWNCYQNHYRGYSWSELETDNLDTYWIELGWSQSSWAENDYIPDTNNMLWKKLTPEQKDAALGLCYFQDSWDGPIERVSTCKKSKKKMRNEYRKYQKNIPSLTYMLEVIDTHACASTEVGKELEKEKEQMQFFQSVIDASSPDMPSASPRSTSPGYFTSTIVGNQAEIDDKMQQIETLRESIEALKKMSTNATTTMGISKDSTTTTTTNDDVE